MASGQKRGHKVGRNIKKGYCKAYRAEQRHEKSHIRRIMAHIKRYGRSDKVACKAIMSYAEKAGLSQVNKVQAFLKQEVMR